MAWKDIKYHACNADAAFCLNPHVFSCFEKLAVFRKISFLRKIDHKNLRSDSPKTYSLFTFTKVLPNHSQDHHSAANSAICLNEVLHEDLWKLYSVSSIILSSV